MFVLIIFFTLSSYTFAPWLSPPELPKHGTTHTCVDWILYHNFEKDPVKNKELALIRDIKYDQKVSFWAAGYAYSLARNTHTFDLRIFGPWFFCARHVIDFAKFNYMTLQTAEFSCEGWIHFYGYDHTNSNVQNYEWALGRNRIMDNHISIWAASYYKYITNPNRPDKNLVTAARFCHAMGNTGVPLPTSYPFMTLNDSKMSSQNYFIIPQYVGEMNLRVIENSTKKFKFMTYNDTKLSCQEWIELHGYTDNIRMSFLRAQTHSEELYDVLDYITRDYATYLHKNKIYISPKQYCEVLQMPFSLKLYYFNILL